MKKFKVCARNKTIPKDQSATLEMGYESPWKIVEVKASSPKNAISKSKVKGKLPTRLFVEHHVVN